VVKGQWPDPAVPDGDVRARFLELVERVAATAPHVAVATHDAPLAREALTRLREARTPCELELLFGLPAEPAARVGRRLGVPVRVYVPFGTGYLPYPLRDARRRPRVFRYLVQDALLPASAARLRLPRAAR
jgi:proline dehydrogenase